MTLVIMSKHFKIIRPSVINYRYLKQFFNEVFRETVTNNLSNEELVHNDKGLQRFCKVCFKTVNDFATINRKHG